MGSSSVFRTLLQPRLRDCSHTFVAHVVVCVGHARRQFPASWTWTCVPGGAGGELGSPIPGRESRDRAPGTGQGPDFCSYCCASLQRLYPWDIGCRLETSLGFLGGIHHPRGTRLIRWRRAWPKCFAVLRVGTASPRQRDCWGALAGNQTGSGRGRMLCGSAKPFPAC